jgi:hypothetical protein
MPDRDESKCISAVTHDADRYSYSLEMAAKEISQLTCLAFRIFKSILRNSGGGKETSDFLTTQIALHEYMFKTLFHIDRNCRILLESKIGWHKRGSLDARLKYLQKKHALSKDQIILLGLGWFENEESTFRALNSRQYRLKVFDCNTACFQIYDNDSEPILKVPAAILETSKSNGFIISQYYFVLQIFRLFQHLQLATQILQLEKSGTMTEENTDEVETDSMDVFEQAAKELFDKKSEC